MKKIKINYKSLLIIIILIAIVIIIINTKNKNNINNISDSKETQIENKLNELNNIDKKIKYFDMNKLDRYIEYKNKNTQLSDEQIIKNVNMNLDKEKYIDIQEAINKNTKEILVNKYYYLDENYIPNDLEELNLEYSREGMKLVNIAKKAFEKLHKEAKKDNMNIIVMSSYRSYEYQETLYNNYVKKDGKENADTYSARPGFSEHQTGLAVDVYNQKTSYTEFENTKEFTWMQNNAYKYGFILRFPKDKENETGYQYESWHYRYVGLDIAKYIHDKNITLEEYIATK